jgi:hypothetical protein
MTHKLTSLLAAAAFALTSLAVPASADARDRRHDGDYGCYDNCGRYDHRRRHHRDDDGDDAIAAGLIGLVIGAVLVSALTGGNDRDRNRDDYSAYERDYGSRADDRYYAPPERESQCMRPERQWDRYANRYVTVDVPC